MDTIKFGKCIVVMVIINVVTEDIYIYIYAYIYIYIYIYYIKIFNWDKTITRWVEL